MSPSAPELSPAEQLWFGKEKILNINFLAEAFVCQGQNLLTEISGRGGMETLVGGWEWETSLLLLHQTMESPECPSPAPELIPAAGFIPGDGRAGLWAQSAAARPTELLTAPALPALYQLGILGKDPNPLRLSGCPGQGSHSFPAWPQCEGDKDPPFPTQTTLLLSAL